MADKKISELNTASAVYDADDFALVQDGETKQVNASTVKAYAKDGLSKSDVGLGNVTNDAQLKIASNLSDLNNAATARTNLGLGNVDNTSDANKPVSTATQTALDGKENADATILKSAAIGVSVQAYDADLTAWAGKTAPTGDAVGTSDTQTLTNKTISGSSNTLSNIANASLTNSSITINGNAVSLGGSTTVSASTTNTLTIGTGLSGTSFNGSAATTIAIDSTVVTLTGTQTLTNKTLTSPSISGGTVNNTAIGGTTPAAGNFTTLGATGNVTLGDASGDTLTINAGTTTFAQGTANGVAYLNGSKVLTTGSALTFDGTNLGIGGSPSVKRIAVIASDTTNAVNGAAGLQIINTDASAAGRLTSVTFGGRSVVNYPFAAIAGYVTADSGGEQAGLLGFYIKSTTTATNPILVSNITSKGLLVGYTDDSSLSGTGNAIFSGNVGIGTSSPLAKFVVSNAGAQSVEFGYSAGLAANYLQSINRSNGADVDMAYFLATGIGSHRFYTSATERMRIDSSGNLGLGVTPYPQTGGGYGSGSYGKLQIAASSVSLPTGDSNVPAGYSYGQVYGVTSQPSWLLLRGAYSNSTAKSGILLQDTFYDNGAYGGRYIQATNQTLQFGRMFNGVMHSSNGTLLPDMTLDASGNLLVGATTASGHRVTVEGSTSLRSAGRLFFSNSDNTNSASIWNPAGTGGGSEAIAFQTGASERMRLDASGNLLVGTTSFNYAANGVGLRLNNYSYFTATSNTPLLLNRKGTTGVLVSFNYEDSGVGNISTNGTTVTFSGTAISDVRLKKDIQPIGNALDAVNALEFVKFKFSNSGLNSAGVIAQQAETVEAIKPFVINGATEADYKAFDYDALLGYMGAAIQELHAEIEQLKQRIN